MYSSHCGAKAEGNFCSECGSQLAGRGEKETAREPVDWSDEIRYEELLKIQEVRDLIAGHIARSKSRMSAEEFLKQCDKALVPLGRDGAA